MLECILPAYYWDRYPQVQVLLCHCPEMAFRQEAATEALSRPARQVCAALEAHLVLSQADSPVAAEIDLQNLIHQPVYFPAPLAVWQSVARARVSEEDCYQ